MLRKSNYFGNAQFLCFTWQTQNDLQVLNQAKISCLKKALFLHLTYVSDSDQTKTTTVCASSLPPFYTSVTFFPNSFETVKTMALVAKGNVFKGNRYRRHREIRLRGNSVASGETEGNRLCLDATVRGWRSLPKGNKKREIPQVCVQFSLRSPLNYFLRKAIGV